ncbi:MAG: HD domain-containing protein [Gammaproteobacteria bacterium]|nr:HD domain-containing protein [Gammaproteobacteria bacterium]
MKAVSFTRMEDGTKEEYLFLDQFYGNNHEQVVDNALTLLKQMAGDPLGYQVDRYTHSLQTATRALRDGADEETIVCALLHDVGDVLAPYNHSQVAAAMLRPYVSEKNHWVVAHHGLFQGYYFFHHFDMDRNARDQYRDHPYYQDCIDFCHRWDQASFDPEYDTMSLGEFEPMVRRVFSREPTKFVE